ncbi:MAG TPA: energy transducer TonB [Nevskiaceae bacterium]|nr:energy transducer TonB [Nevskiaceae bacterium]
MFLIQSPFARPLLYAGIFALSLFWLLHALINRSHSVDKSEALQTVDFVRLRKDTDIESRIRQKPPKPQPPKEPPPPKMQTVAPQERPNQQRLPFNIPNLNTGLNFGGGPFIGNLAAAAEAGGYSELIPLVALQPQYPRQAARDGIEGWVDVEITIGPDGSVKSARAKDAKPRGVFEAAAISAALKSRFRPKMVEGKGVEATGIRRYSFNLGKE